MKGRNARAADAGFVLQFHWYLREQRFGDLRLGAPARAFVGGGRTELALVRTAAQWTLILIG